MVLLVKSHSFGVILEGKSFLRSIIITKRSVLKEDFGLGRGTEMEKGVRIETCCLVEIVLYRVSGLILKLWARLASWG
jgi:hypothetical protein